MSDSIQSKDDSTLDSHQKAIIRQSIIEASNKLLGIPYRLGAEWTAYGVIPTALDCSELVEGVYNLNGLKMPDGSQNQFDFTIPTGSSDIGDLGFFGRGGNPKQIYHVGLIFDKLHMIEARGLQPESNFETGKVILRIRSAWENYKDFCGYRCHPKFNG